jgi:hypothetical protein
MFVYCFINIGVSFKTAIKINHSVSTQCVCNSDAMDESIWWQNHRGETKNREKHFLWRLSCFVDDYASRTLHMLHRSFRWNDCFLVKAKMITCFLWGFNRDMSASLSDAYVDPRHVRRIKSNPKPKPLLFTSCYYTTMTHGFCAM